MALLNSCSVLETLIDFEPVQKLDPAVYYKNNMCFDYDGKKFCGVGVVEETDRMRLKITTGNKIDKFVLTTCHREISTDEPDKGLFRKNGVVRVNIRPTLEFGKACPYYFGAFGKRGKHSWGIVYVRDLSYDLEARVYCNGGMRDAFGAFICESRQNLIQKLVFKEPIALARPTNGPAQRKSDCPELKLSEDKKTLEYKTPNRECLYGIIGLKSLKAFQLFTVGYEQLTVE